MTISPLSDATARAITSSLVLSDSISVVKELIDNSLDARADHLTIEISANTLDAIQVKDNGIGIGVEDRQLLCKRSYTSKVRTIDDIVNLGGTSLGFRGEALASVAQLSGFVTVTTRVDGETVATLLKHDRSGKLVHCASAPHGTGTTVRVDNFLKSVPVRKQTALKQTAKTLTNLRKLLFDYAFARPTVRFLLKVIKAKNDKTNWSYIPCKEQSDLVEACSRILGKDVVNLCKQELSNTEENDYTIRALLLSPEPRDFTKIQGLHQYCSIDGRPVDPERGVMKDLFKSYRSYLVNQYGDEVRLPQKPFAVLHLTCPQGSYDVNIEPAKNEVLFEDKTRLLRLLEQLLQQIYGDPIQLTKSSKLENNQARKSLIENNDFNVLLARPNSDFSQRTAEAVLEAQNANTSSEEGLRDETNGSTQTQEQPIACKIPLVTSGMRRYSNMYSLNDEGSMPFSDEVEAVDNESSIEAECPEGSLNPQITNPFTLAKLQTRQVSNGPYTQLNFPRLQSSASPLSHHFRHSEDKTNLKPLSSHASSEHSEDIQEPYQNPGPPSRPWKRRTGSSDDEETQESPDPATTEVSRTARPSLLENWVRSVHNPTSHTVVAKDRERQLYDSSFESRQSLARSNSVRSDSSDLSSPLGTCSSSKQKPFRTPVWSHGSQKRSPISAQNLQKPRGPEMTPTSPAYRASALTMSSGGDYDPSYTVSVSPHQVQQHNNGRNYEHRTRLTDTDDLDHIMDFEHRKRDAILQHRKSNRYQAGIAQDRGSTFSSSKRDLEASSTAGISGGSFIVPARPQDEGQEQMRNKGQKRTLDLDGHRNSTTPSETYQDEGQNNVIPPQPASASYTQNPHWNRSRAAIRRLDQPVDAARSSFVREQDGNVLMTIRRTKPLTPGFVDEIPPIPPSDPRGVLIKQYRSQQRLEQDAASSELDKSRLLADNSMTSIKQPKLKTLPFETLIPERSTYNLVTKLSVPFLQINQQKDMLGKNVDMSTSNNADTTECATMKVDVINTVRLLALSDSYIERSSGYLAKVDWELYLQALNDEETVDATSDDELHAALKDMQAWEARIMDLLCDARFSQTSTSSENTVDASLTNLRISLANAIRKHVIQME